MNFPKKLIVLSAAEFFPQEEEAVIRLFDAGMERFHLRKPGAGKSRLCRYIERIPDAYRTRIVLHDAFELASAFGLAGIHLNRRNSGIPPGFTGSITRSCHSLEEVRNDRSCEYVFLSPVFSSISKAGYESAFSADELEQATAAGLLTSRVIALGGVDSTTLPLLAPYGFGGVAVLGALWQGYAQHPDPGGLLDRFRRLQQLLTSI